MRNQLWGLPPEKKIQVDPITGCWIWLGSKDTKGYGSIAIYYNRTLQVTIKAHKYFYEKKYGKVPPGLELDHIICNNTSCCNPDHVKPVTTLENVRRSVNWNSIKTHCKNGHEYNEINTYYYKGERRCKICTNERRKQYFEINGIRYRRYDASPPK